MAKTEKTKGAEARSTMINFSLSKDEKAMIEKAAAAMGVSVSGYIRYKVLYEKKEA